MFIYQSLGLVNGFSIILACLANPDPCICETSKLIELLLWYQAMWAWAKALIMDSGQQYPTKVVSNGTSWKQK
jgi:hypothetical protein